MCFRHDHKITWDKNLTIHIRGPTCMGTWSLSMTTPTSMFHQLTVPPKAYPISLHSLRMDCRFMMIPCRRFRPDHWDHAPQREFPK
jgi:hypothetical protein